MMRLAGKGISFLLLTLIDVYRLFISPLLGKNCRFDPVCSVYASQVIRTHGPIVGVWLTARRLLRCHPFSKGGIDHPPVRHRH
ncbi:membrane protein insertion efficiency factor YidD [Gluconobacter wancherniae]|nr:membrane protein insertion efficiency factor YidD [Gluconobacter wancherniae]